MQYSDGATTCNVDFDEDCIDRRVDHDARDGRLVGRRLHELSAPMQDFDAAVIVLVIHSSDILLRKHPVALPTGVVGARWRQSVVRCRRIASTPTSAWMDLGARGDGHVMGTQSTWCVSGDVSTRLFLRNVSGSEFRSAEELVGVGGVALESLFFVDPSWTVRMEMDAQDPWRGGERPDLEPEFRCKV